MADYLVFEGRADSFAHLVYPQRQAPWTNALTPQQEKAAWKAIQPHLSSTSPSLLLNLMFGGGKGVPQWAGYTIGFNMVQAFLKKRADPNVDRWTAIEAGELLKQSGYASQK